MISKVSARLVFAPVGCGVAQWSTTASPAKSVSDRSGDARATIVCGGHGRAFINPWLDLTALRDLCTLRMFLRNTYSEIQFHCSNDTLTSKHACSGHIHRNVLANTRRSVRT